jgi:pimeloyl-ACP methyl ester carboxylesterase
METPTLVLHGGRDRVVPWQAGRSLAGRLQRSRFSLYEEGGHDLPAREAASVSNEIRSYLEKLS